MTITKKIRKLFVDCYHFIMEELWNRDYHDCAPVKRFLYALMRIVMIVCRSFKSDRCNLHASALTYITLVSLVPILAIAFSFSQGFGIQKRLTDSVGIEKIKLQNSASYTGKGILFQVKSEDKGMVSKCPKPMQQIILNVFTYVEKTNFAALGLVGLILLLLSVVFSMNKLESTVNYIWGIREGRTFFRQLSEYLVLLILLPVIFLSVTSINTVLSSDAVLNYLNLHAEVFAWVVVRLRKLISVTFIVGGFIFFYLFFPNTKVRLLSAVTAGVVGGALWLILQWVYIVMQVGLTKYNAIYGTFAALPFFLAWLYANWCIILLGVEISFAVQNYRTVEWKNLPDHYSVRSRVALALLILLETCRSYKGGTGGWAPLVYARKHNIPRRVIQSVVERLRMENLLIVVDDADKDEKYYVPGRVPEDLSIADVEDAFQLPNSLEYQRYAQYLPENVENRFSVLYHYYHQELKKETFEKLL